MGDIYNFIIPVAFICAWVFTLLLFLGYFAVPFLYFLNGYMEDNEVPNILHVMSSNTWSEKDKIYFLFNRTNEMFPSYGGTNGVIPEFPFLCIRSANDIPYLPLFTKCGACAEHANLFTALANKAGIKTRTIRNPGGDHNWVEIYLNGTWVAFESVYNKNNPAFAEYFFENKLYFPTTPIYVYVDYNNGTKTATTQEYSDIISNLTIYVHENNSSVENASVSLDVNQTFLGGMYTNRIQNTGFDCYTNENGFCSILLGNKISAVSYNASAKTGSRIGFSDIFQLDEDETLIQIELNKEYTKDGDTTTQLFTLQLELMIFIAFQILFINLPYLRSLPSSAPP
jgi:hypothetical protein